MENRDRCHRMILSELHQRIIPNLNSNNEGRILRQSVRRVGDRGYLALSVHTAPRPFGVAHHRFDGSNDHDLIEMTALQRPKHHTTNKKLMLGLGDSKPIALCTSA